MKFLKSSLFVFAFVVCLSAIQTGCMSANVQKVLNATLPPDYEGDAKVTQKNPYTQIEFTFTKLHKLETGLWSWEGFTYDGHSAFTQTSVSLSPLVQK